MENLFKRLQVLFRADLGRWLDQQHRLAAECKVVDKAVRLE
jgi:hypothetical protein